MSYCAVKDANLHVQNVFRCEKWCREFHSDKPEWNCYHHPFLNEEAVSALRKELEVVLQNEIIGVTSEFDEIQNKSLINTDEDPRKHLTVFQLNSKKSIHYNLMNNDIKDYDKEEYEEIIPHDLKLRNLSTNGNILECQERLKNI